MCNALSSAQSASAFPRSGGRTNSDVRYWGLGGDIWQGGCSWLQIQLDPESLRWHLETTSMAHLAQSRHALLPIMAVLTVTAINVAGIRRSVHVTDVVVVLSISCLVAVVILGLPHGNPANFVPFAPSGFTGILRATGLVFFAYTGYSRIGTLVEEVRNPETYNSKGYRYDSWFRYTPIPFRCRYRDF